MRPKFLPLFEGEKGQGAHGGRGGGSRRLDGRPRSEVAGGDSTVVVWLFEGRRSFRRQADLETR